MFYNGQDAAGDYSMGSAEVVVDLCVKLSAKYVYAVMVFTLKGQRN